MRADTPSITASFPERFNSTVSLSRQKNCRIGHPDPNGLGVSQNRQPVNLAAREQKRPDAVGRGGIIRKLFRITADRLDVAVKEFETATRQMPANAQLHFYLAQAYRRAGRKEDAQRESDAFEKLKVQQDPLAVPALRPFSVAPGRH